MPAELPPPPDTPDPPPRVKLAGEQAIVLRASDGVELEARAVLPPSPQRSIVLCHPHPLYGGSMDNAIILMVARILRDHAGDRVAVLRFNFRGVGDSGGAYDQGRGEVYDALAAIGALHSAHPQVPITLLGYSFGSWVALRAGSHDSRVERLALIAPATKIFGYDVAARPGLPIEIAVGDHDEFVEVHEARAVADRLGARLHVIEGAEHNFLRQRRIVAERLLPFLVPEI